MSTQESNEEIEDFFSDLIDRLKFSIMRLTRSAVMGLSAVILAAGQSVASYSAWQLGIIVLILGSFNPTRWIAVFVIAWLTALYLASPEILSIGSTLIASASK